MHENETSGLLPALPFLLGAVSFKAFPAVIAWAFSEASTAPAEALGGPGAAPGAALADLGWPVTLALLAVVLRVGLALAAAQWLPRAVRAWRQPGTASRLLAMLAGVAALFAFERLAPSPLGPADAQHPLGAALLLFMWQFGLACLIAWVALLTVPGEARAAAAARPFPSGLLLTVPWIAPALLFTAILQSVQALQVLGSAGPGAGAPPAAYLRALQLHDASTHAFGLGATAWSALVLASAAAGLALSLWARRSCDLQTRRIGRTDLITPDTEPKPDLTDEAERLPQRMP